MILGLAVVSCAASAAPAQTRSAAETVGQREMGQWLRANGEAVYATTGSPYEAPAWGRYATGKNRLYAHIIDCPKDGQLTLSGVTTKPSAVYLLADRKPLVVEQSGNGWVVRLPAVAPSSIASVLVVEGAVGGQ
jgi:alpha-L-fucosidase